MVELKGVFLLAMLLPDAVKAVTLNYKSEVQKQPACHGSNGDYLSFKMDRPILHIIFQLQILNRRMQLN